MSRVRVAGLVLVVILAAGGVATAGFGIGGGSGPTPTHPPPETATVVRETLVDYEDADGVVDYGAVTPLRYQPPEPEPADCPASAPPPTPPPASACPPVAETGRRLVTWLPGPGTVIGRGEALFRVDDRPVVLLYGSLPLYRTLAPGATGADVAQWEENLRALGYEGFTVDEHFTEATATLVRRWQRDVGLVETGRLAPGQAVYAPGALRVAAHLRRVGEAATGEILAFTGTERTVVAALDDGQRRFAEPGTEATVLLPDGGEWAGSVAGPSPGPDAEPGTPADGQPGAEAAGTPTGVRVLITLSDPDAGAELPVGPVRVRFVAQRREDVLTVPVLALVALTEGGYGLQVVDGGQVRYVPVETGLFARGRVEISGGGVRAGTVVVMPG